MSELPNFSSRTLTEHLARGVGAGALITLALWLLSSSNPIGIVVAVAALVGAALLLRGCPMCWLTGLFETIQNSRATIAAQKHPNTDRAQ